MAVSTALKAIGVGAVGLLGILVFVLAVIGVLALYVVPPVLLLVLVFPAWGIVGWGAFWAFVAAFLLWALFLGLITK